jgi:predicted DNA binding CopG/RHH family protein
MSKIPKCADDREEAAFWDTHDSTETLNDTQPVDVTFIDARPPKAQISLRIDTEAVRQLKLVARRKGVGYQTLIRMWVMERLQAEMPQPR